MSVIGQGSEALASMLAPAVVWLLTISKSRGRRVDRGERENLGGHTDLADVVHLSRFGGDKIGHVRVYFSGWRRGLSPGCRPESGGPPCRGLGSRSYSRPRAARVPLRLGEFFGGLET